ncbi:hypothetical protein CNR22_13350 [Sphingobacteriaceae bacterium]|nr:hypothetical protein CNR22_13350 [Sphingobacteriaceae bacterium]
MKFIIQHFSKRRVLKTLRLFVLVSSLALNHSLKAQCALYPVSLAETINNSSTVAEGKIISKKSFWNQEGNYIYTSNLVRISQLMKGSLLSSTLEVITEGGEIDFKKQLVEPSLQLNIGDEGIFTLNAFEEVSSQFGFATFRPYADQQGFIKYEAVDGSAHAPFRNYTSIGNDLYQKLATILGTTLTPYSGSAGKGYNPSTISSITGMSPLTITAGTFSVLTISGSGFGTTQSTSIVEFSNADDGGSTFIQPDASQYVSWSNTQIQVIVPTRSGSGTGTAGTGLVRVTVLGSSTLSAQTLTVDYGELNLYYSTTGKVYNTQHVNLNGNGGITWQMYNAFDSDASAKASFIRALQSWRCATHINWLTGSTTTTNVIALDGVSVVRFDIGSELPNGVLGRCTSYFSGCSTGTVVNWYVSELDICFDEPSTSVITWQFGPTAASGSQYDFESCALHELGHGHQLSHVINSNDVMHYALANAQNNRNLVAQNLNAGNDVMSRNTTASVCGYSVMTALTATNCLLSVPVASFVLTSSVCAGQTVALNDLSTNVPSSWSWTMTGGSPSSSTVQNTSVLFASAGNYSVSLAVANAFGTSTVLTKTITVVATPVVVIPQASLCSGNSTLVTATGATSYTWNPGALTGSTQTLNPASTTIYTVMGSNGSCIGTTSSTLTVINTPTISVPNASICNGSSTLITAGGAASYTWNPGNLTGISQNLNPTVTTVYTVTGANGSCFAAATAVFTISVTNVPTVSVPNATICSGTSTLIAAGGATSYTWNPGNLTGASQNLNPTAQTIYTVTGANGLCTAASLFTLYVNITPGLSVSNASICSGTSTTSIASGASTYTWMPGNLSGSATALSPTATTIYSITGAIGTCTSISHVTVFVTTTPTVLVSASSTLCAGNSAIKTASGATSFTWLPGGLTGNSQTFTPLSTTNYTVVGANGSCTHTNTSAVSVYALPSVFAIAVPATICVGNTSTLAAAGGMTYTWTNSVPGFSLTGASPTVNPLSNTLYSVAAFDGTCIANTTISVQVDPYPVVSVNSTSACSGSTAILSASGASSYNWNPGFLSGASQTLNPTATTVYTVTGTNPSGCATSITATLSIAPLPTLFSISSPTLLCAGEVSTLTATGGGGSGGPISYSWSNGLGNSGNAIASPTTTTIYTVTGSDGLCATTSTVLIQVNPVPTLTITASSLSICSGQSATLTASGATSYLWPQTLSSGSITTVTPPLTFTCLLEGSFTSGCTSTTAITISVAPTPTLNISASPTSLCQGQTTTITASGAATYVWNPGIITGSAQIIGPSASTNYSITGTTGACSSTNTLAITVYSPPVVFAIVVPTVICAGSNASLAAAGGMTYTWTNGVPGFSLTGASPITNPTVTTNYTVAVSDGTCINTTTVLLQVNPVPILTISPLNASICSGQTATLTASGANSYTWLPGASSGSMITASPASSTSYTLQGSLLTGCATTSVVPLSVSPLPSLIATASQTSVCAGVPASLSASGASTYIWSPGNLTGASIPITPSVSTIYTVTGTSSLGCSNSETVGVAVYTLYAYASFTPGILCVGQSATLSLFGGTSYTWAQVASSSSSIVVSPTVNTIYNFTVMNGPCYAVSSLQVFVNPAPNLILGNPGTTTLCAGNSLFLNAIGADVYNWQPGNISGSTVSFNPSSTTIYTVTGTFTNSGCSSESNITLTVIPKPSINVSPVQSPLCTNTTATLTATGSNAYTWTPGNLTGASQTVIPSGYITFTIDGSSQNCGTTTSIITIPVNPSPTITAIYGQDICIGQPNLILPSGATAYTYQPGNLTGSLVLVTPTSSTTYTIIGSFQGCYSTLDNVLVNVTICDGIAEQNAAMNFNVYPNPANDKITVDFGKPFSGKVMLVNALGQLLAEKEIMELNQTDFVLAIYPQGIYFLKLSYGPKNYAVIKLIKH